MKFSLGKPNAFCSAAKVDKDKGDEVASVI